MELLLTQNLSFFYSAMTDDKWKKNLDMQAATQVEPGFVKIYVKQVCSLFYT